MHLNELDVSKLCGVVVECVGSENVHDYQIIEDFVVETAFGPYDQECTTEETVRSTICQMDAYRIRRGLTQEVRHNPAARELAPIILRALGLKPKAVVSDTVKSIKL